MAAEKICTTIITTTAREKQGIYRNCVSVDTNCGLALNTSSRYNMLELVQGDVIQPYSTKS